MWLQKLMQGSIVVVLFCAFSLGQNADSSKDKRQVRILSDQKEDHQVAETGFAGPAAVQAGSKYFQYAHVPAKDHYEHGHKRGNEHHFIEKHEKAHPHAGEFKTKVRWGDKHGGYGEHYWDYNHAGHHDGDGEESQQNAEYAAYEETKQTPKYVIAQNGDARGKRRVDDDVEFINDDVKEAVLSGVTGKHGGNYRKEKDFERGKREQRKNGRNNNNRKINGQNLVYEPDTGVIVDEKTGISYELRPVELDY